MNFLSVPPPEYDDAYFADLASQEPPSRQADPTPTPIKLKAEEAAAGSQVEEAFSLDQFAINGQVAQMRQQMIDDKPAIGRWALMGQITILFMVYNGGKTLIVLKELINAVNAGRISGDQAYYVNADDTFKGLVLKGELAEQHGFKMLAPGHNGFKADQLLTHLKRLVATDQARGKVIILDTAKKFIDVMDKSSAAKATEVLREFSSKGGTVVILAHVNKHKGADGKAVHEGTGDLVNDADCSYVGDVLLEDAATGLRSIRLENKKARGDVPHEVVYQYDYTDGKSYHQRLSSLVEVGKAEREAAKKRKDIRDRFERNRKAIEALKECISEGVNQKTALIQEAHQRSGITKAKIAKALEEHTGNKADQYQFWHLNVMDKNAHVYQLNYGVGGGLS